LAVVGSLDRVENEGSLLVDLGVPDVLEVDRTTRLGPDDDRQRRVRFNRAIDPTHQSTRQIEPFWH
jgi:hypothetical protein